MNFAENEKSAVNTKEKTWQFTSTKSSLMKSQFLNLLHDQILNLVEHKFEQRRKIDRNFQAL